MTTSFHLLILISLRHFVAGPDFCFVADLCNCAANDDLFLFCVVSLSFYSFLCCVFSHVMNFASVGAIADQWSADGGCHLWQSGDAHVPISNEIASGISAYRLCHLNLCRLLSNTSDTRCDFSVSFVPDSSWFIHLIPFSLMHLCIHSCIQPRILVATLFAWSLFVFQCMFVHLIFSDSRPNCSFPSPALAPNFRPRQH